MIYPFFPKPDKLDYIVKMFVGSQEHKGMFHNNAFDLKSINNLFKYTTLYYISILLPNNINAELYKNLVNIQY